ncbi:MAG TPA: threonine ammonia-lyase [Rhizomicrobium sp.]|nr:threonine ammonia-lyase [Rhizomicrobium sp.]
MAKALSFPEVTIEDVRAAAAAIAGAVERTPTHRSLTLSKLAGCEIHLKFENLQFTASFKERGALNKLLSLTPEERKRGVAAMSAGNHAQGVAYHAGRLGIPVTIVMPEGTPFNKVKHTKDFGARVVIDGATLTQAFTRAREIADAENLVFIHPYDDPIVIAGQGTVALELLADADVDVLVVPIGGGGLISGISVAAKAIKSSIEIYGVEASRYPSMYDEVKGEELPCAGQTIAEGIAVKEPGVLTRKIIGALVKDILLVREDEIERAVATLLEIEKTVVEGAGAAAYAAVAANPEIFRGKKVGIVLSGGNIDMRLLSNVILRELAREGRILSVVVEIEDRPGLLAKIATLVGEAGGNILEVSHNRMMTDMTAKSADLGMVIEARDAGHAAEIRAKLEAAGFMLRSPQQSLPPLHS